MRMLDKMDMRSNAFSIVLNDNELHLFKSAEHIKQKILCSGMDWLFIACIKHDRDYNNDAHCYKREHYHLVLTFSNVHKVSSVIDFISDLFKCNANQVSCEKCNSVVMQTRYLIHLDDFDKAKYSFDDIVSNRKDLVDKYLHQIKKIIDEDDLFAIMREYPKLDELISHIGIENYRKWRCVIQDLRKERYF